MDHEENAFHRNFYNSRNNFTTSESLSLCRTIENI